jgi:hypothetical protein
VTEGRFVEISPKHSAKVKAYRSLLLFSAHFSHIFGPNEPPAIKSDVHRHGFEKIKIGSEHFQQFSTAFELRTSSISLSLRDLFAGRTR